MTDRVLPRRALTPWLAMALAILSVLGYALAHALIAGGAGSPSGARAAEVVKRGAATPSAATREALSAAMGAADPAYRVRGAGGILRAFNPRQGLTVGFRRSGLSLDVGAATLGLGARSVRYGSSLAPVLGVAPRAHGNLVEYAHPGIREWYANGPLGIEQGFTLTRPPAARASGNVTLTIALSGGAHARL